MAVGTGRRKGQSFPSHVNSRDDCSSFVPLTSYRDSSGNLLFLWKLASEGLGDEIRSSADRQYPEHNRAQENKDHFQFVPGCFNHPNFFLRVRLRRLSHQHETEFVNDCFVSIEPRKCEFRASGGGQANHANRFGDEHWERCGKYCQDDAVRRTFHRSGDDNSYGFSRRPIVECYDFRSSDDRGCANRNVDGTRRWRKYTRVSELVRDGIDFAVTAGGEPHGYEFRQRYQRPKNNEQSGADEYGVG